MSVQEIILKTCREMCDQNNWICRDLDNMLVFEVYLQSRRTQACVAVLADSEYGQMLEIMSSCGATSGLTLPMALELLAFNINLSYARVQLDANKENINVCARTLATSASLSEIQTMVEEVAVNADYIEQQLFGTDSC
jgi:hypothetical protein